MGSAVSAGADNDELISNLCQANYISSANVERSFRIVDRGNYFPSGSREQAYSDLAWKQGNIHISAPCIYCEVLESLELRKGLSFLNIGSGTGYLSTLAGLILGPFGCNHGVEIHADVVQYACEKLDEFLSKTPAHYLGSFCKPTFVIGNGLHLNPIYRQYDRVYCGASCPASTEFYIKSLLKPGGVLVMPVKDNLVKYQRNSDLEFEKTILLPVQFSPLLEIPDGLPVKNVIEIESQPLTLKEVCRFKLVAEFSREWTFAIAHLPLPTQLIDYLEFNLEPEEQPVVFHIDQ